MTLAKTTGTTTFWKQYCEAVNLTASDKHGKGKGKLIGPAKPIVSPFILPQLWHILTQIHEQT